MEKDDFKLYHDTRNMKRRKYLKYNNKCGYSRKRSPCCPFCHPKRNDNTGIIDFTTNNRLYKNDKKNVFINCYMDDKNGKNNLVCNKIRLLTCSYY